MRLVIPLLALALITSCRSHKEVQTNSALQTDSLARSEHHRTIVSIDSLIRNTDFSFDTLKVSIERPSTIADVPPEIIRLTAVNGRVIDRRKLEHNQVEDYNRLDTVAYKQSAARSSAEHSATTRLYEPPDGTAVAVVAIILIAILIYIFRRKQ